MVPQIFAKGKRVEMEGAKPSGQAFASPFSTFTAEEPVTVTWISS